MVSRFPSCTPRDLERALIAVGFSTPRQKGSHRIFVRPGEKRPVVLPIHARALGRGFLRDLIKQLGLTPQEFHALLLGKSRGRRVA